MGCSLNLELDDLSESDVEIHDPKTGQITTQPRQRVFDVLQEVESKLKGDFTRIQDTGILSLQRTLLCQDKRRANEQKQTEGKAQVVPGKSSHRRGGQEQVEMQQEP